MANLAQLNKDLADKSYINGYVPSAADATTVATVGEVDDKKFPNVARWARHINSFSDAEKKAWTSDSSASTKAAAPAADDDDVDLFGSDDDDEAVEAERARLLAESEAKKKQKGVIMRSSVILDVKPFDDETDLKALEAEIRKIQIDGLEWKAGKLEAVAYGIQKLVINAHIEDDKVSTDIIEEKIMELEDYVQSVDIAAFNKL